MSPWRRAICAICCAPAAPPRRPPSPRPGSGRDPGQSHHALPLGGLAADRRSALALARRRRAPGRHLRYRRRAALARRARRAAARPPSRPAPAARAIAARRHPDRRAPVQPDRAGDPARCARLIVEAVERHVAQLPPPEPGHPTLLARRAPIRFAGSWSVRLTGEGFHVNHVHPAGWLSSAFYVALPEAAMGGEAHAGWLSIGEATELGLDLPPIRLDRAEAGPARPLPFDHVARDPPVRGGRAADGRLRRRQARA